MGKSTLKMKRWEQISQRFKITTDKLGMPIDKGIIETVIALNALGFKTKMSCEGHIGKSGKLLKKGLPFPWVTIVYSTENVDLSKINYNQRKLLKRKSLKKCQPVMLGIAKLLDEFYKKRQVAPINKILVTPHTQGELRIQSLSGYFIESQSKYDRLESFKMARHEMHSFTKFLKAKFFL